MHQQTGKIVVSAVIPAVKIALLTVFLAIGVSCQQKPDMREIGADIESRVQTLQNLVSAEYLYRNVVYVDRQRRVLGVAAGSNEVLFSIAIRVQAGIDLSNGFSVDVSDEERIFVTLPEPEVILVDADEQSIEEYFSAEQFLQIEWLDIGTEVESVKENVRTDAIDRGILDLARTNAESLLKNILQSGGYEHVYIRFKPVAELVG